VQGERMNLRDRIARLYQAHPRGARAETRPTVRSTARGQTWLAQQLGMSPSAIRRYVSGSRRLPQVVEVAIRALEREAGLA